MKKQDEFETEFGKFLESEKQDLIKRLTKLKKEVCGCEKSEFGYHSKECDLTLYGYNQAIEEVIHIIKKI